MEDSKVLEERKEVINLNDSNYEPSFTNEEEKKKSKKYTLGLCIDFIISILFIATICCLSYYIPKYCYNYSLLIDINQDNFWIVNQVDKYNLLYCISARIVWNSRTWIPLYGLSFVSLIIPFLYNFIKHCKPKNLYFNNPTNTNRILLIICTISVGIALVIYEIVYQYQHITYSDNGWNNFWAAVSRLINIIGFIIAAAILIAPFLFYAFNFSSDNDSYTTTIIIIGFFCVGIVVAWSILTGLIACSYENIVKWISNGFRFS